jgi:hypothetical protein
MRRGIGTAVRVVLADRSNIRDLKKRAGHGVWQRCRNRSKCGSMSFESFDSLMRTRHGLWKGVST